MNRAPLLRVAVVLGASLSLRAHAWDPSTHASIVKSAFVIAPAAESRIPTAYRDAFFQELGDADLMDKICRYHRGPEASKDPAAEAERILREVSRSTTASAYTKTLAIARYLHYVADCAVPGPIAAGTAFSVPNFWPNKDFIVYREARPLHAERLGADLKQLGAEAQWADDLPGAYPSIYRLAVNLTIDALALLPAPTGSAPAADAGPVLFVVNRQDTGRSATSTETYGVYAYDRQTDTGVYGTVDVKTGGQGKTKSDLMLRKGLQVAEVRSRRNGDRTGFRVLLFNNQAAPACGISLTNGSWSMPEPRSLPPGGLAMVSGESTGKQPIEDVTAKYGTFGCPEPSADTLSTARRIVVGNSGVAPQFEKTNEIQMPDSGGGTQAVGLATRVQTKGEAGKIFSTATGLPTVELDPALLADSKDLLTIESFKMRPEPGGWRFRVSLKNLGAAPLGMLTFLIDASLYDGSVLRGRELVLDCGGLMAGRFQEFSGTLSSASSAPTSFRVTALRRPAALAKIPPVSNRLPRS